MLSSCGKTKKPSNTKPAHNIAALKTMHEQKLLEAEVRRTKDGWLDTSECDAMLFTGKYSCTAKGVNIGVAEYPNQPGRFNRRPEPFCEVGAGSATSWSRDMGAGLIVYSWCNKDLPILERHAAYGTANYWKMGEPLNDGRVVYTPALIGQLYSVIYALGGENNANRAWPGLYSPGLSDYQAHLQMLDIWLRSDVAKDSDAIPKIPEGSILIKNEQELLLLNDGSYRLLDVSESMYARIKEHSDREKRCPFYQYMRARYDGGDFNDTIDILLSSDIHCEYYRGDSTDDLALAEWLFASWLVLKTL